VKKLFISVCLHVFLTFWTYDLIYRNAIYIYIYLFIYLYLIWYQCKIVGHVVQIESKLQFVHEYEKELIASFNQNPFIPVGFITYVTVKIWIRTILHDTNRKYLYNSYVFYTTSAHSERNITYKYSITIYITQAFHKIPRHSTQYQEMSRQSIFLHQN
jgi:hypothetical protein